jgi:hypothetical protein
MNRSSVWLSIRSFLSTEIVLFEHKSQILKIGWRPIFSLYSDENHMRIAKRKSKSNGKSDCLIQLTCGTDAESIGNRMENPIMLMYSLHLWKKTPSDPLSIFQIWLYWSLIIMKRFHVLLKFHCKWTRLFSNFCILLFFFTNAGNTLTW